MYNPREITQTSAAIVAYFARDMDEELRREKYYVDSSKTKPVWEGKIAERLGINGQAVTPEVLKGLLDGFLPDGTSFLHADREERRAGWDFTCTPPKSVSIMTLFDPRILQAFTEAEEASWAEIAERVCVRVRKGGANHDERTGELLCTRIFHNDSRGCDVNAHFHRIVPSLTVDKKGNWRAIANTEMYQKKKLFSEIFRSELCRKLRGLGYDIRQTADAFEIVGVSDELCERYSVSSRKIKEAEKKLSKKLGREITDNERAALAAEVKDAKQHLSEAVFMKHQYDRLSPAELAHLKSLVREERDVETSDQAAADAACAFGVSHCMERSCVALVHDVAAVALSKNRGHYSWAQLKQSFNRAKLYRDNALVTTRDHLILERRLIDFAKKGAGELPQFVDWKPNLEGLTDEQARCVTRALTSRSAVTIISGAPGSGKSYSLKRIADAFPAGSLAICAPTTRAVDVLREDGLPATTLAKFLIAPPAGTRAVLVDEGSLIGTRDAARLVKLAERHNIRLLVSGDLAQNRGVASGSPMAVWVRHAKQATRQAALTTIRRQENPAYRSAIQDMVRGKNKAAQEKLIAMGAFTTIVEADERRAAVAQAYCRMAEKGSVCAVAHSWSEIYGCTAAIRGELRRRGKLGSGSVTIETLRTVDRTTAQKLQEGLWDRGWRVQVVKAGGGLKAGAMAQFSGICEGKVRAKVGGKYHYLDAESVQAVQPVELDVSTGDKLLMQGNSKPEGFTRGTVEEVQEIEGNLVRLKSGKVLDPSTFRNFTHGYVLTSHSAQGQTADRALVIQEQSMPQRGFFVACSRGKHEIQIITEKINLPGEKDILMTATELYENSMRPVPSGQSENGARQQLRKLRHLAGGGRVLPASRPVGAHSNPGANDSRCPNRLPSPARDTIGKTVQWVQQSS